MARRRKQAKAKRPKRQESFSNRPLAELKELVQRAGAEDAPAAPQRKRRSQPTAEAGDPEREAALFTSAMEGVARFEGRATSLPPEPRLPQSPPLDEREELEVMQALRELVFGDAPLSIFETDEAIEGLADGVDTRLLTKLKKGEYSIQDHLDLHGYSREQARGVVSRFVLDAIAQGKRCVLIIHGRGHGSKDKIPVLKLALRSWLARSAIRKTILAFCTALPCDGGAGAVYVLLRKSPSEIRSH